MWAFLREIGPVKLWKWKPENLPSVIHSIRTAIAATVSLAVARLFGLPEAYWAAIATPVVMQSTRRDSVDFDRTHCRYGAGRSGRRAHGKLFHGESLGLRGGGICAGTLVRGISHGENRVSVCRRHLAIIVLIPRSHAAWIVALHRFFEVSVGILIALALVAVWPERQPESAKQKAE
jgi:hypothetical protein